MWSRFRVQQLFRQWLLGWAGFLTRLADRIQKPGELIDPTQEPLRWPEYHPDTSGHRSASAQSSATKAKPSEDTLKHNINIETKNKSGNVQVLQQKTSVTDDSSAFEYGVNKASTQNPQNKNNDIKDGDHNLNRSSVAGLAAQKFSEPDRGVKGDISPGTDFNNARVQMQNSDSNVAASAENDQVMQALAASESQINPDGMFEQDGVASINATEYVVDNGLIAEDYAKTYAHQEQFENLQGLSQQHKVFEQTTYAPHMDALTTSEPAMNSESPVTQSMATDGAIAEPVHTIRITPNELNDTMSFEPKMASRLWPTLPGETVPLMADDNKHVYHPQTAITHPWPELPNDKHIDDRREQVRFLVAIAGRTKHHLHELELEQKGQLWNA